MSPGKFFAPSEPVFDRGVINCPQILQPLDATLQLVTRQYLLMKMGGVGARTYRVELYYRVQASTTSEEG